MSVYFDFFQQSMTVVNSLLHHRMAKKGITMSNLSETLTTVKTDILHASISFDNEKKQINQKEDAARMLKARRAIEQHAEQKRLLNNTSNGWDD